MMGSPINKDSVNIMGLIEPNSIGAEVGVWFGNSSQKFLGRGVRELHLVDAWSIEPYKESTEHGTYENYLERYSKMCGGNTEKDFQKYYDSVYRTVKSTIGTDPRVTIYRMNSNEWFDSFDKKLDWIYVDGDHSYEGCLRDLNNALKVVRVGGLILGDDYKWPDTKFGKTGVTRAVDKFCYSNGLLKEQHGQVQFSIKV
jgi:hypothetical protein